MVTLTSTSPEETARIGEEWGRAARPGLVIGLSGDLGAGKTQLVKGLAAGLGISARVHSPTFSLINIYEGGRLPLCHIDLYRLTGREAVHGAGLEEYLRGADGVVVVEWIERWFEKSPQGADAAPARCYRHAILRSTGETERQISYEDSGS